ncbi:hypothetical protein GF366_04275 [Candidatus Peregrinibacteria bacterium]|nr:hypothetical protein [Candidatus Peregrinibacteria bacterium]
MDVDKVPILGRVNRTLNIMMVNFILLAIICITLGIVIPFFPKVLDLLISALLIVATIVFLNIAYNIHSYKKKYIDWFKE